MHDDFNVIYPPIVEQAFEFMRHVDGLEDVTKAEVYRALVSKRLIDAKGNPTLSYYLKEELDAWADKGV